MNFNEKTKEASHNWNTILNFITCKAEAPYHHIIERLKDKDERAKFENSINKIKVSLP
jgi:hypothetical protein